MRYFPARVVNLWLPILIHFIICLSLLCSNSGSKSVETDRLALVAFKAKITEDPLGMMRLWNDSTHLCEWHGVTCGTRHKRVTELSLFSLQLGGSISPHVGNLSFLHVLQLQNNSFIRQIPPEIGRLRRLRLLNLLNNSLGGEVPANLSRCSQLRRVILSNNKLEGEIPPALGSLSKLLSLRATVNGLTGTLPPSLGNLTSLEELYLAGNKLGGTIPESFGSLSHLTCLALGGNQFSGQVPSSLYNLSSMEIFDLGYNKLGMHIPSDLFHTLPDLQLLSLDDNQFVGPIPASLSNASNLQVLQISRNKLTGKVPTLESLNLLSVFSVYENQLGTAGVGAQDDLAFVCSLTNATTLSWLLLQRNNFGGMFPQCITNLSSQLTTLSIDNNYISGSIPAGIDNLIGLESLLIWKNSFSGTIPSTIGNLQNLGGLDLSLNSLSGVIPSSLGKLSKLVSLQLSSNSLEGEIPSSLQNCTFLLRLNLKHNNLSGSIPPQVLMISSLSIAFSVAYNQLTGPLPEEVGKLTSLIMLDVSSNMLSGNIPASLGECTSMQILGLYSNNFSGSIPSSMSSMRSLEVLDLDHNNLSGQIPEFIASFDFILLDLSFNDLEGAVPKKGVFLNASATSLQGNTKLCGGISKFHLPECSISPERKKRKLSVRKKITIAVVVGLAGVALVILLVSVLGLRRRRRQSPAKLVVGPLENPQLPFVSYGDLHRSTNGFSGGNLVGKGSFGHVYKGILGEEGQIVAVKVLNLNHFGASKSFVAECEALRNIRHKNLVKLLTVCSGVDYQGNEFKALVYEFMPNGSLEEWLHPPPTSTEHMPPRKLGLLQRLSIASDVASLLKYVHHEFGTPLVHCDIKPSNILVDGDLSGRVSDFGLAKFLSDSGFIHGSVEPSSSIGVRGTVGYAPPEYGVGSEASTQGDVYSYGILLLEMFTGKRPTHDMFKEGLNLHLYSRTALPSGVINILDPDLQDPLETDGPLLNPRRSARVMDCLVSVIQVGVECSLEAPAERMDMRMVTSKLHRIRDVLFTN